MCLSTWTTSPSKSWTRKSPDAPPYRNRLFCPCPGCKSERTVFTMQKFTLPDGKCLVVELNEKNGGRHQSFVVENDDLVRAEVIDELKVR